MMISVSESVSTNDSAGPTESRRWWHRPWIWVSCGILLLLAATPFAIRGYYLTRVPYIDEPFNIAAYETVLVTPEENAYPRYLEAFAMYVGRRMSSEDWNRDVPPDADWQDLSPAMHDLLAKNEPALAVWRQATELPKFVARQPSDVDLSNWMLDCTGELLTFARLAELKVLERQHAGRDAEAWQWLHALLRHADQLQKSGGYLECCLGLYVESRAVDRLHTWSYSPTLGPDDLLAAAHFVRRSREHHIPASKHLQYMQIPYRNTFRRSDWPDWCTVPDPWNDNDSFKRVVLCCRGEPEFSELLYRHFFVNLTAYCDRPRWLRPKTVYGELFDVEPRDSAELVPIERLVSAAELMLFDGGKYSMSMSSNEVPEAWITTFHFDEPITRLTLAELELTIQAYLRDVGQFPESLDHLVPRYLSGIPLDPMSPGPEPTPIVYRQTNNGALLYSVGDNGIDDGGLVDRTAAQPADLGWKL